MSWQVNPKTGDYVMTKGAPIDDPSLIYPAYYRLKVKRTQWLYAPDNLYGSDFWTVKKRFGPGDVNPLSDIADKALQPMIDDGRADSVVSEFRASIGRNDAQISTTIVDAEGTPQSLNLPVIGG